MQQELIDDMNKTAESIIEDLKGFADGKYLDIMTRKFVKKDAPNTETLYEYLTDNCGIRYTVDQDLDYVGCRICMGWGGPNIYLDTMNNEITGYWGYSNEVHIPVDKNLIDMVDEEMEYEYNCRRGM